MAKKNSTKTATKEALQAAEPRVQAINGWKGVNFSTASVCWDEETHEGNPKDLDDALWLIENNVDIDPLGALVTRPHEETVFTNVLDGWFLTGVSYLKGRWLYMALENGAGLQTLIAHDITDSDHTSYQEVAIRVEVTVSDENPSNTRVHPEELEGSYFYINTYDDIDKWQTATGEECKITDIYSYLNNETPVLIVMAHLGDDSVMFIGDMDDGTKDDDPANNFLCTEVRNRAWLPTPADCGDPFAWNTRWGWRVEPKANKNPKMMEAWGEGCIFRITPNNPSSDPSDPEYLRVIDLDNNALYDWENVDPALAEWELSAPDVTKEDTSYYDVVSEFTFVAIYANEYGSTTLGGYASVGTNIAAANFTYSHYLSIYLTFKPHMSDELLQEVTSIQLYVLMNESITPTYIGMIERPENGWKVKVTTQHYYDVNDPSITTDDFTKYGTYEFKWYGALQDTDEWSDGNLSPSKKDNTTTGPDAAYVRQHDGRLYWWGSTTKPYRLTIGGNSGTELNISQGYGGDYIDIEPGVGTIVNGTQKWKTASGASIVTILCGNENTRSAKRFNLVENNITVDTQYAATSYMVEEIANTVGCQSNWGSGVWADGLYVVDRYGLLMNSMAMEYNTQIQEQTMSEAVRPVFSDELGDVVKNARMVYVDKKTYIIFGDQSGTVNRLDDVVLVYDVDRQAWWTYTYLPGSDLHHLINIDFIGHKEGIGLVTDYGVDLIPTTSPYENASEDEKVRFHLESGEILCTPVPRSQWAYVAQLQLWFDWFYGDMDIEIRGTDYYGRHIEIKKHTHTDECVHDLREYIRINCYLESFRLKITGTGTFRLTHMLTRSYSEGRRFTITRGWDALEKYRDAHSNEGQDHCYIKNYANLREVLLT